MKSFVALTEASKPLLIKLLLHDKYVELNKFKTQETKSIYYAEEKDFKAYLTFRCINNRSTLDKPNLDHMCSSKFSFETWRKEYGSV